MSCQIQRFNFHISLRCVAIALASVFLLLMNTTPAALAQTFTVLHDFTSADGSTSLGTLLLDKAGNLYGTMQYGAYGTCNYTGSAFQLKPTKSGWFLSTIHCFDAPLGGDDGAFPINHGGLIIGPDGSFYGTTEEGGIEAQSGTSSLGVVFKLSPPPRACLTALCPWTATVLYKFKDSPDGSYPHSNVAFDREGNIYGTTFEGGSVGYGSVFKLAKSGGGWTESTLTSFPCCAFPEGGVAIDSSGNLYGVMRNTSQSPYGVVFQLMPSGSGWTRNILYRFTNGDDGGSPVGGLIFDQAGNLYGSTGSGGSGHGGTVFQLSPSGGAWTFTTIYSLHGNGGPQSSLAMDEAGNLYGTTLYDGAYGGGSVFKLTRSGGGWTYSSLYDFYAGGYGGFNPVGGVTLDSKGNLYGTTTQGGADGYGTIFQVAP